MAMSGFEGFEKRLELQFSGNDPLGLRRLSIDAIQQVLHAVQCTIVSAAANRHLDSYVLSESSLFVYPYKIIIKTCGTTQLLKSITCLLSHTAFMNLQLRRCRYTRGSFIFPSAQPFPHTSFTDEVLFLEETLPATLCYRKARVLPSKTSHSWHVYTATDLCMTLPAPAGVMFTVEVCMTELDRVLARRFYRRKADCEATGHEAGKEMTESSGIDAINPRALICDFAFDPCGYSMNGLDRDRYSTIHVTPEDGYSYASFECVVRAASAQEEITDVIRRAARVFRPGTISVSVCMQSENDGVWTAVADALKPLGLGCRSRAAEGFPGVGTVSYQTFVARRK